MKRPVDTRWAGEIYPNKCSCGVNYEEAGESYEYHLKKVHLLDKDGKSGIKAK